MTADFQSASSRQGRAFEDHTERVLKALGYTVVESRWRHPDAEAEIDFVIAKPGEEETLWIECKGSWESTRNGLERTDTTKKLLGTAFVLNAHKEPHVRYIVVTSNPPKAGSSGATWLALALQEGIVDEVWTLPLTFEKWTPEVSR